MEFIQSEIFKNVQQLKKERDALANEIQYLSARKSDTSDISNPPSTIFNILVDSRRRDLSGERSCEQSPDPGVSKFSPERDIKSASNKKLLQSKQKIRSPLNRNENKSDEEAQNYEEKFEALNNKLRQLLDSETKLKDELEKLKKDTKKERANKENQKKSPEKFNKEFEKKVLMPLAKTLDLVMFKQTPKKDLLH